MSEKKILNVGCRTENYGNYFIDLYPQNKRTKKCNADTDRFPFPNNFFDEVYSSGFFEHLRNPMNFLKESRRILKKGGKIIIITDNASFWGWHTPFSTNHYGGYERRSDNENDRHYGLFTSTHLENHLDISGFEVTLIEWGLWRKDHHWLVYIINKILGWVDRRIFNPSVKIEGFKK